MTPEPPSVHGPYPARASFDGIPIEGVVNPAPSMTVGETLTYTFVLENRFGDRNSKTDAHDPLVRLDELESYGNGDDYTTLHLSDGRYQFVDESDIDDPSPLVRLEADPDLPVTSCYGLVESVERSGPVLTDSDGKADGPIHVDVTLFCLSRFSAYRDKDELRRDLEAPGF